jgi:hypothetical protein
VRLSSRRNPLSPMGDREMSITSTSGMRRRHPPLPVQGVPVGQHQYGPRASDVSHGEDSQAPSEQEVRVAGLDVIGLCC